MRWTVAFAAAIALLTILAWPQGSAQTGIGNTMRAFTSDAQLRAFVKQRVRANRRRHSAEADAAAEIVVTASAPAMAPAPSENITNRQEADVDEGGIVKVHGDHLVILRRGRLFTVSIADAAMRPKAHIDAFPPGTSGEGAWYDEMLISGDRVIVIGYSYARGGTEINRFAIGRDGSLRWIDTHHLRSDDYYSSRNYASRLIGTKLIFYTPLSLDHGDVVEALPGMRRWRGNEDSGFTRIAPARRIYVAEPVLRRHDADISTLHSIAVCDLARAELDCDASATLGSWSRTFYVSGSAVYVWISDAFAGRRGASTGIVYRLPLNGGAPSAMQVWGGPVDQFSFREDRADGLLNVVVRADSGGDWMWRPEVSDGDTALLRLPLSQFGDGSRVAGRALYRSLPRPDGDSWSFHNRFVGRHLLYSGGELQERRTTAPVFAVPLGSGAISRIEVPHGVDRFEILGDDGLGIGGDREGALGFTAIELESQPRKGDTFLLPAASEGENRSHAFFFRPDSANGADGVMGLPVTRELRATAARFLGNGSAILFLARNQRRFKRAGELEAEAANARDDACQASCVDWYGNARPIFLRGRVFALMGYELVEGAMRDDRIREVARVNFAPAVETRRR